MAITRIKIGGWSQYEKLTYTAMNAVDVNVTNALDKRVGQTDTLSSLIDVNGALAFKTGSILVVDTGSTAYVATNNFNVESGGRILFKDGATCQVNDNALLAVAGDTYFASSANISFDTTTIAGTITGALTINSATLITCAGNITYTSTHTANYNNGTIINFGSSTGTAISGMWTGSLTLKSGFGLIGAAGSSATLSNLALDDGPRVGFVTPKNLVRWVQCLGDNETEVDPAGVLSTYQDSGSGTGACWITIPITLLPNDATLTNITVYFKPNTGHGALPSFSTLKLYQKDSSSTAAPTQIGSTATDTAVSVAAYESGMRSLSVTTSTAIDLDSYRYVATLVTESGANALQGMKIHGAKLEYTTSYMDDY